MKGYSKSRIGRWDYGGNTANLQKIEDETRLKYERMFRKFRINGCGCKYSLITGPKPDCI
jgi:hypothetical protein